MEAFEVNTGCKDITCVDGFDDLETKFNKSRLVPLHGTVAPHWRYLEAAARHPHQHWMVGTNGKPGCLECEGCVRSSGHCYGDCNRPENGGLPRTSTIYLAHTGQFVALEQFRGDRNRISRQCIEHIPWARQSNGHSLLVPWEATSVLHLGKSRKASRNAAWGARPMNDLATHISAVSSRHASIPCSIRPVLSQSIPFVPSVLPLLDNFPQSFHYPFDPSDPFHFLPPFHS